jgi:translation elongation factor EF-G
MVVDALEGVTQHFKKLMEICIMEDKPIILVINKIDRLILELKLPPEDAYLKIKNVIDNVNLTLIGLKGTNPMNS